MDDLFVTNAVLCARRGEMFRGTGNFSPRTSTENCLDFLRAQLEIVSPLVVVTLGTWPLWAVSRICGFNFEGRLGVEINARSHLSCYYGIYNIGQVRFCLVPVFHPAAAISRNENIRHYSAIWAALRDEFGLNGQALIDACFPKSSKEATTQVPQLSLSFSHR